MILATWPGYSVGTDSENFQSIEQQFLNPPDSAKSWAYWYDIRHFSGTATYLKTFNIPAEWISTDERLFLDLGTVCVIAQVRLNGKDMGILWGSPYPG